MNRKYANLKNSSKAKLMRQANFTKTLLKRRKNINSQLSKSKNSDKKWKENAEQLWQRISM